MSPRSGKPAGSLPMPWRPFYVQCYELTCATVDKYATPACERVLLWLPERDESHADKVLLMLIYPEMKHTNLVLELAYSHMWKASPFANPVRIPNVPFHIPDSPEPRKEPQRERFMSVSEVEFRPKPDLKPTKLGHEGQRCAAGSDLRPKRGGLPQPEPEPEAEAGPAPEPEGSASRPDVCGEPESEGSGAKLLLRALSIPDKVVMGAEQLRGVHASASAQLGEAAGLAETNFRSMLKKTKKHVAGVVSAQAEKRFGDMRINPFDGLVVLELDWNHVTGFDYWNPLTQEGRFAVEVSKVRKRCFRKLSAAVEHYHLQPTDEARKRCGLGVDRGPDAELFNQPAKFASGPPARSIPWPDPASAPGFIGPAREVSMEEERRSLEEEGQSVEGEKTESLSPQMVVMWFTCALLPGAMGTLLLRANRAKQLRLYEAGLPGWSVNLPTYLLQGICLNCCTHLRSGITGFPRFSRYTAHSGTQTYCTEQVWCLVPALHALGAHCGNHRDPDYLDDLRLLRLVPQHSVHPTCTSGCVGPDLFLARRSHLGALRAAMHGISKPAAACA